MAEPMVSPPVPQILESACPLDCPDACSLEVRVVDGRVVKVDGNHLNPITQGYICSKVRRVPEHLYGPDRLLRPARRVGPRGMGQFEDISWDQALDLAAAKLREARDRWGGESILPFYYGGSNGMLTQDAVDLRLFSRLGASRLARHRLRRTLGAGDDSDVRQDGGCRPARLPLRAADRALGGESVGVRHPPRALSSNRRRTPGRGWW